MARRRTLNPKTGLSRLVRGRAVEARGTWYAVLTNGKVAEVHLMYPNPKGVWFAAILAQFEPGSNEYHQCRDDMDAAGHGARMRDIQIGTRGEPGF